MPRGVKDMFSSKKKLNSIKFQQYLFCFYVLLPTIVIFAITRFIPIGGTFYLSFYKWDFLSKSFIGFSNFITLFQQDTRFHQALWHTVLFIIISLPLIVLISLMIAILLNRKIRFYSFYEFVYFLPAVVSMVPITFIWKWIYDPDYGLLNFFLSLLGISPKAWLLDPKLALGSIMVIVIWKNIGYYAVIFLVGLKGISRQYYEAAELDGANKQQLFVYITLPLLKPITLFVIVMVTITIFNIFTPVYVMTSGDYNASPVDSVRVLVYDIYQNGFRYYRMGYASAESLLLFIIVFIITLIQLKITKSE